MAVAGATNTKQRSKGGRQLKPPHPRYFHTTAYIIHHSPGVLQAVWSYTPFLSTRVRVATLMRVFFISGLLRAVGRRLAAL